MSLLTDQEHSVNIAIFGSNGDIAKGFIQHVLITLPNVNLHSISRKETTAHYALTGKQTLTHHGITAYNDDELSLLSNKLNHVKFDLILVATGGLHNASIQPEKRLNKIEKNSLESIIFVNTLIPMLIAKHMLRLMPKQSPSAFCALGARVGSISDNQLGGWYSYRASKAALVMMLKTLSIETKMSHSQLRICALHPGTVDTNLSKPFQSNVKPEKLFKPEVAGQHLFDVINKLNMSHTGLQLAWDGSVVPY